MEIYYLLTFGESYYEDHIGISFFSVTLNLTVEIQEKKPTGLVQRKGLWLPSDVTADDGDGSCKKGDLGATFPLLLLILAFTPVSTMILAKIPSFLLLTSFVVILSANFETKFLHNFFCPSLLIVTSESTKLSKLSPTHFTPTSLRRIAGKLKLAYENILSKDLSLILELFYSALSCVWRTLVRVLATI